MIYDENPLHVEIVPTLIPIANEVRIDVESEPVIDPKNEGNEKNYCEMVKDIIIIGGCVFLLLCLLGGFILFLVWIYNPIVFGTTA